MVTQPCPIRCSYWWLCSCHHLLYAGWLSSETEMGGQELKRWALSGRSDLAHTAPCLNCPFSASLQNPAHLQGPAQSLHIPSSPQVQRSTPLSISHPFVTSWHIFLVIGRWVVYTSVPPRTCEERNLLGSYFGEQSRVEIH